jgi:nicotinamide/nicotinate riboside kinase
MSSPQHHHPPLLVALSGPSSSGKTTIAHLLARIFSSSPPPSPTSPPPSPPPPQITTHLLHADDFYRPESALPFRNGFRNWDCVEALDVPRLENVLGALKSGDVAIEEVLRGLPRQGEWDGGSAGEGEGEGGENGDGVHKVPPPASAGAGVVSDEVVAQLRASTQAYLRHHHLAPGHHAIILTDGFLLLGRSLPRLRALFSTKILLRASYADAKARRERRKAYVTLDGFWEDPEGYFEGVVWPAWGEEHGWLFEGGDVQGELDEGVCGREGIAVAGVGMGLEEVVGWCVGVLRGGLVGVEGGG